VRVDYAFVAEAADSQAGLFYVTRGGADIYVLPRDFPPPLRLGAISFVVRLMGDPEDVGQSRAIAVHVVDERGQQVGFRQEGEVRFERHPIEPGRATASVMTFRLYGFPVPDFGAYRFEVLTADQTLAQVPFWVVPPDQVPQGMTGVASQPEGDEGRGYL
jgi:hypothetical protein